MTEQAVEGIAITIEGLRKLNDMLAGTSLPRLDIEQIEALIHRDSLSLVGLD